MRIGRLKDLIAIERRTISGVSESNEPIYSWEVYRECWAEAYDVRSQEVWSEENSTRIAETTTRFRIHYNNAAGINAEMRVRFNDALYDIKSILVDHVRKQDATIDAVAQGVTVAGAALEIVMEIPDEAATVGSVFQSTLHIFGGTAPFSVSLADGSPAYVLPPGLNLVQASDTSWSLEGFPTTAGGYPISITVTDADGLAATIAEFTLEITDGSP